MRDLAAEHQADLVARELSALRELRDATLRIGRLLARSNRYETLTKEEGSFLLIAFDNEGMGPFTVPAPEITGNLVLLATDAKALEVTP